MQFHRTPYDCCQKLKSLHIRTFGPTRFLAHLASLGTPLSLSLAPTKFQQNQTVFFYYVPSNPTHLLPAAIVAACDTLVVQDVSIVHATIGHLAL